MTEQDRALRALSLKIVDELWPIAEQWIKRGLRNGDPGYRSAAETFNASADGVLSRYLPRLPSALPPKSEFDRVFHEVVDVIKRPADFERFPPGMDPYLVIRTMMSTHELPLYVNRCSAFKAILDHYRSHVMG
jgi:hypothetical protein